MKILVFSDSHGNTEHMLQAAEREKPDRILHLGDGWDDVACLQMALPGVPVEQVAGNCDFRRDAPAVKCVTLEGKRILLCHGHTYRVKEGLLTLGYAAREQGADLACFGHTHVPTQEWAGETLLLNPGSIGYWGRPSYAVVRIEDGRLTADLRRLE